MSATAQVRALLQTDPVLHEALRRRILNVQAAARWIIASQDLTASVESVVSVLRRLAGEDAKDWPTRARAILRASHINTRANLASVSVPNSAQIQRELPTLLREIRYDRGDALRVISCDRGFKIIIDEVRLPIVLAKFGEAGVDEIVHGLTEFSIVMPAAGAATPGVIALVCTALAARGINIPESAAAVHQHIVFIEGKDAPAAFETLIQLVRPPVAGSIRVVPGRARPVGAARAERAERCESRNPRDRLETPLQGGGSG